MFASTAVVFGRSTGKTVTGAEWVRCCFFILLAELEVKTRERRRSDMVAPSISARTRGGRGEGRMRSKLFEVAQDNDLVCSYPTFAALPTMHVFETEAARCPTYTCCTQIGAVVNVPKC